MAQVMLSKEAQRDLISIRNYIRDELRDPDAAKQIMASLKDAVQSLADFSGRGRPLDALIPVHTEYRYLVCVASHTKNRRRKLLPNRRFYLLGGFLKMSWTVLSSCAFDV